MMASLSAALADSASMEKEMKKRGGLPRLKRTE